MRLHWRLFSNWTNMNIIPFPLATKTTRKSYNIRCCPSPVLKIITSFTGFIEPFINPDPSLYYTLNRNRDNEPENAEQHKPGERTLYITVFDHKERTTRVYTRDNESDIFYSKKSDAPSDTFYLKWKLKPKLIPKATQYPAIAIN